MLPLRATSKLRAGRQKQSKGHWFCWQEDTLYEDTKARGRGKEDLSGENHRARALKYALKIPLGSISVPKL